MKKRFTKFLALFLSATMVFTMNTMVFGATGAGEAVEAEEENRNPDILQIRDDYNANYANGFNAGYADAATKDTYRPETDKENFEKENLDYQAGYEAGYSNYNHYEYIDGYDLGFNRAYVDAVGETSDTDNIKDEREKDGSLYKKVADDTDPAYQGESYKEGYQKGYDAGYSYGVEKRKDEAKNAGINYAKAGDGFRLSNFKNEKPEKEYSNVDGGTDVFTSDYIGIEKIDKYTEEYIKEWRTGYDSIITKEGRYNDGYEKGKLAGRADGMDPAIEKSPKDATEAEADTYPAAYKTHWNYYNQQNVTVVNDPVNEDWVDGYKKGYDDAFTPARKYEENDFDDDQANAGYREGYYLGREKGEIDSKRGPADDTDTADKIARDPGGDYEVVMSNDNLPEAYRSAFDKGYLAGYAYATGEGAYDDGYRVGLESGKHDAGVDKYGYYNHDIGTWTGVEGGYYEPDYPNSTYSYFLKNGKSKFAEGYVAGYLAGYEAEINHIKNDRTAINKPFDYAAPEMDAWRISSDPATWDTAQLLIDERQLPQDADHVGENLFFDTNGLTASWLGGGPGVYELKGSDATNESAAGNARAELVATSPFQYYFDLYENGHLVDKKTVSTANLPVINNVYVNDFGINNGSIGQYLYKAIPASSNKAIKLPDGTIDTGITYVIIRYRLAGAETNENYKVRRYSYESNGKETFNVDNINNYYQSEAGSEPVVAYDSRKVMPAKPEDPKGKYKPDNHVYNDKSVRNAIDAEALVISWTAGSPCRLIGKLDLKIAAKNNVAATVPHTYLTYLGDTEIDTANTMPSEYTDVNGNSLAPDYIQTDKGVMAGAGRIFSRYYKVKRENADLSKGKAANRGSVTFAGTSSAAKLTSEENAFVNKKGDSPSFTLKAGKMDPTLKPYGKGIKTALKGSVFNFEISRMKIASDFDTHMEDVTNPASDHYTLDFKFEDTKIFKELVSRYPRLPRRSDWNSLDEYKAAVEEYKKKIITYNKYKQSDEFEKLVRSAFKDAVEAYKAEYNSLVSKYGSKLDYMKRWIEEDWAVNTDNTLWNGRAVEFPYEVPVQRVGGRIIPPGNNSTYKNLVPEDANGDGVITAVEHYQYETYVATGIYKDQYDKRFDGNLKTGDNIPGYNRNFVDGVVDYANITIGDIAVVEDDDEVTTVTINYNSYIEHQANGGNVIIRKAEQDGKYYYGNPTPDFEVVFAQFIIYVDFLDDADTDIGLIEDFDVPQDTVLYPGGQLIDVMSDGAVVGQDRITIDFINPVIKGKKGIQALTVNPMLISRVRTDDPQNPAIVQKKLKVFIPKVDNTGAVIIKKIPKADIRIDQKMAETEPFLVATGINNFEGSIAMRIRKNGDLGYGYYKNDDYYYIFNEEE